MYLRFCFKSLSTTLNTVNPVIISQMVYPFMYSTSRWLKRHMTYANKSVCKSNTTVNATVVFKLDIRKTWLAF